MTLVGCGENNRRHLIVDLESGLACSAGGHAAQRKSEENLDTRYRPIGNLY